MYNRENWKIISDEHITLSATIKGIKKINKKTGREWRLPSPEELENLPIEAAYMANLNISDKTFYWTNYTNSEGPDPKSVMVTIPCTGHTQNRHYMHTDRKNLNSQQEEIYAVATCD